MGASAQFAKDDSPAPRQTPSGGERFARLWALGFLTLHAATYPLWGWGKTTYPRVPFVRLSGDWIAGLDLLSDAVLLVALLAIVIWPRRRRLWWCVAAPLAVLVLLDQHRLQPWAYQTLLYALILATRPWPDARRWIMAITISIYCYSSMGKFDFQFVHTVGSQMVATLARPIGGLDHASAVRLAFLLPAAELATAILLALPPTRRVGGVAAIAMHVTLIGLLGPWALGHSLGVLAWNALLACQAWCLFVTPKAVAESVESESTLAKSARWSVNGMVLIALVAPLGERRGLWDHWTSWALYSPHNSRVEIEIHRSVAAKLPTGSEPYLRADTDGDGWRELEIDRWSLGTRLVPVYPQARYQLGVALALADAEELGDGIRVRVKGVADRWMGTRHETFAIGIKEMQKLR